MSYMEYRFRNPFEADKELKQLESEGWVPVCPLSAGYGYLMYKED